MPSRRIKGSFDNFEGWKTAARVIKDQRHQNQRNQRLIKQQLGTVPEPIDNDTLADCCILLTILTTTNPAKVADFFALNGSRNDKIAFLLRHGHFEQWRKQ